MANPPGWYNYCLKTIALNFTTSTIKGSYLLIPPAISFFFCEGGELAVGLANIQCDGWSVTTPPSQHLLWAYYRTCRVKSRDLWRKIHQTWAGFLLWKHHNPITISQTLKPFPVHPMSFVGWKSGEEITITCDVGQTDQFTPCYRLQFKRVPKWVQNGLYRLDLLWCLLKKPHSQGLKSASIWKEGKKENHCVTPLGFPSWRLKGAEKNGPWEPSIHQVSLMFLSKREDRATSQVGKKGASLVGDSCKILFSTYQTSLFKTP